MQETEGPASGYAAAVSDLRATARWLVAGGAAIAAALVAGLNLRSVPLSDLSLVRQVLAGGALLIAYGLAVWLVLAAARVLIAPRLSLNDLSEREMEVGGVATQPRLHPLRDDLLQFLLDRKTELLLGQDTITGFYTRYAAPLNPNRVTRQQDEPASTERLQSLIGGIQDRAVLVTRVEDAAQYFEVSKAFARLRRGLPWGAAMFAAAVLGFVWLTAPTEQPAAIRAPLRVDIHVTDAQLAGVPVECVPGLTGITVGGTLARPDLVTEGSPGCPPVRIGASAGVIAVPVVK
jgi:hypothetical protein